MDNPMPPSLVEPLDRLEDPRGDRTKLHHLTDILTLPHGILSHDTPGRVCARLDAVYFEEGFRDRVQAALALTEGQSVRGSHDRGRGL